MTATKTSKSAKDGTSTAFTLEMAAESVSGNIANATYLAKASDETLIDPMPASGGSVTANLGTLNGAATAAKQPALGTAGAASADVITVQGVASMTPVKVDGSAVTQPASAASGAFADGAIITMGTAADAAWSGSGSSTLVAALKAIYAKLAGIIGVSQSGTWTVQPGNTANTTAWKVDGSAVTQPVSMAVAPALVASVATIGKVDLLGNAGGVMDAAGQNAASPANELLVAAQFNTSPATITSGNVSPLQMDSAGNLLVNIKAGAAAGGTSSNFAAAFPGAGTAIGAKNGANMVNLAADGSGNLQVNLQTAIPAGANAIGSIIGRTSTPSVTPVVTAAAYTAGQEAGGLMTFAVGGAGSGLLESIRVTCKSVQTTALKLYIFDANPTNTTWTDKSTPAINAADVASLRAMFTLSAPDSGLGTHTIWSLDGIACSFIGANLYGVLVVVATPTFASTSDITVKLGIVDD